MEHEACFTSTQFTRAQYQAGIPYPFSDLPPADEPMTDVRLADVLGTVLAQLAGLTQALAVTRLGEVPDEQLHAVHELLAGHAKAAQTMLRRWMDDRQDD